MSETEKRLQQDIIAYTTSKRLSGNLLTSAFLGGIAEPLATELQIIFERLEQAITRFERIVWFGGVQAYCQQASIKGHSMQADQVKVLLYAIAGRALITLSDGDESITLITEEDSSRPRMGLQSIDGTAERATRMLDLLVMMAEMDKIRFEPDSEVSLI